MGVENGKGSKQRREKENPIEPEIVLKEMLLSKREEGHVQRSAIYTLHWKVKYIWAHSYSVDTWNTLLASRSKHSVDDF